MDVSITPEALEDHGRFVRRIARALLGDESRAEDVAQEALTRWVLAPPPDRSRPRAWLATVARSLAANGLRRERTRAHHEAEAARPEALEGPDESVERAELLQRVVAAVRALEPELREALLARYYRGLSLRAAARELGVTVDVLRLRERLALDALRRRLDRSVGQRALWTGPLAALLRPARALASPLALSLATLAVGGAAALVVAFAFPRGTAGSSDAPDIARIESASPTRAARAAGGASSGARTSDARPPVAAPSTATARDPDSRTTLRGRLVDEDGAVVPGGSWSLCAWRTVGPELTPPPPPITWQDRSGPAGPDGRFEVVFEPPTDLQFRIGVEADGFAVTAREWDTLAPGATLELGDLVLVRAGAVRGRILDAQGRSLGGEPWEVVVQGVGRPDEILALATADPVTGSFVCECVPHGVHELTARSPLSRELARIVEVEAGRTTLSDLEYDGPDLGRRIAVPMRCGLFVTRRPGPTSVHLEGADGTPGPAATRLELAPRRFFPGVVFDDVGEGPHVVRVEDSSFLAWSMADVEPGTSVEARLEPAAEVRLTVRGLSDEAARSVAVAVTAEASLCWIPLAEGIALDGAQALALPMVPGDWTFRVTAGSASCEVRLQGLEGGESRSLLVDFADRPVVAGRVLQADGAPASGVDVRLRRRLSAASSASLEKWRETHTTTDPAGRFEFQRPVEDGLQVVATGPGGVQTGSAPLLGDASRSVTGLELVLPAGASVHGRVVAPSGANGAGLRIAFRRENESPVQGRSFAVDAQGRYAAGSLPEELLHVRLLLPEEALPRMALLTGGALELGTVEPHEGELLERDFTPPAWPGAVTLHVRLDGRPASGEWVRMERVDAGSSQHLQLRCDAQGLVGPITLFSGRWVARLVEPRSPVGIPFEIVPSGSIETDLAFERSAGSLRVLGPQGQASGERALTLYADDRLPVLRTTTDPTGLVRLALEAGHYAVRLDPPGALLFLAPDDVTQPLVWPPQGDEPATLRF